MCSSIQSVTDPLGTGHIEASKRHGVILERFEGVLVLRRNRYTLIVEKARSYHSESIPLEHWRLLALVDYLEEKGADVSRLKTALLNSDSVAVREWFEASRERHMETIAQNKFLGKK